ncbi:hypothetical protein CW304_04135 [Bacillus sp. UFRGS-B20]|nr:hypothetical protein CW304_04135 [Bacillus sp. UFRGS-B20]
MIWIVDLTSSSLKFLPTFLLIHFKSMFLPFWHVRYKRMFEVLLCYFLQHENSLGKSPPNTS